MMLPIQPIDPEQILNNCIIHFLIFKTLKLENKDQINEKGRVYIVFSPSIL